MPMPSMQELQTMYGSWNPQAYLQGQHNAGLEQQFQQSQNDRAAEQAKQASLDTLFRQQDDPNRVQERVLQNQNLGYTGQGLQQDNETKTRNNRIAAANEQLKISADKAELLAKATTNDLARGEARAKQLMMSEIPEEQVKGQRLYALTAHARDLADARTAATALQTQRDESDLKRTKISADATVQAAQIGADSRLEIAKLKQLAGDKVADIKKQVLSGKLTYEKAATLLHGAAAFETDPDLKATYEKLAGEFGQEKLNVPTLGNKPDMGAMGIPATPAAATTLGGGGAKPQHSLANLKGMYPGKSDAELKAAYKAKYGVDPQ